MVFSRRRILAGHVAVDIGSSSVKLATVTSGPSGLSISRAVSVPLPRGSVRNGWIEDSTAVAEAIQTYTREAGLQGAAAITALPGRAMMIKALELPLMDDGEVENAIEFEAMQAIPENLDNVFLDYQMIDASEGDGLTVLLAAAKKELVRSYTEVLARAGLNPTIIDVDYLALHNLCNYLHPEIEGQVVCVMHAGASLTTLSIIQSRKAVVLSSGLDTAGEVFTHRLATDLGISVEEAEDIKLRNGAGRGSVEFNRSIRSLCDEFTHELDRELKRFTAMIANQGMDRLFVCGGAIKLAGLWQTLWEHLHHRTGRFESLLSATTREDSLGGLGPEFAVVGGLALRQL